MRQQTVQQGVRVGRVDGLVVVENDQQGLVQRFQVVAEQRTEDGQRRLPLLQKPQRFLACIGHDRAHGSNQIGDEAQRIALLARQREPSRRRHPPAQPVGDEQRLAITGRRQDQRQRQVAACVQPFAQFAAYDIVRDNRRTMQSAAHDQYGLHALQERPPSVRRSQLESPAQKCSGRLSHARAASCTTSESVGWA